MNTPPIVTADDWTAAREELAAKEEAATAARAELAAARRHDFGVDEWFGINVFLRDNDDVFRTHFLEGSAVESVGNVWSLLDLLPYGCQQEDEDSPDGYPQEPPTSWYRRHDEYEGVTLGNG